VPQFAVFFADGAGFGIEMVQAMDAAHAQDIARAQHPTGRLSAVPAELLDGKEHHKLLRAWIRGKGAWLRKSSRSAGCGWLDR
jgi:hypothetical protein